MRGRKGGRVAPSRSRRRPPGNGNLTARTHPDETHRVRPVAGIRTSASDEGQRGPDVTSSSTGCSWTLSPLAPFSRCSRWRLVYPSYPGRPAEISDRLFRREGVEGEGVGTSAARIGIPWQACITYRMCIHRERKGLTTDSRDVAVRRWVPLPT